MTLIKFKRSAGIFAILGSALLFGTEPNITMFDASEMQNITEEAISGEHQFSQTDGVFRNEQAVVSEVSFATGGSEVVSTDGGNAAGALPVLAAPITAISDFYFRFSGSSSSGSNTVSTITSSDNYRTETPPSPFDIYSPDFDLYMSKDPVYTFGGGISYSYYFNRRLDAAGKIDLHFDTDGYDTITISSTPSDGRTRKSTAIFDRASGTWSVSGEPVPYRYDSQSYSKATVSTPPPFPNVPVWGISTTINTDTQDKIVIQKTSYTLQFAVDGGNKLLLVNGFDNTSYSTTSGLYIVQNISWWYPAMRNSFQKVSGVLFKESEHRLESQYIEEYPSKQLYDSVGRYSRYTLFPELQINNSAHQLCITGYYDSTYHPSQQFSTYEAFRNYLMTTDSLCINYQ